MGRDVGRAERRGPGGDGRARTACPAGTDAKWFSQLGVRCFGFSPLQLPPELDFSGMFHGIDERVAVTASSSACGSWTGCSTTARPNWCQNVRTARMMRRRRVAFLLPSAYRRSLASSQPVLRVVREDPPRGVAGRAARQVQDEVVILGHCLLLCVRSRSCASRRGQLRHTDRGDADVARSTPGTVWTANQGCRDNGRQGRAFRGRAAYGTCGGRRVGARREARQGVTGHGADVRLERSVPARSKAAGKTAAASGSNGDGGTATSSERRAATGTVTAPGW